MEFGKSMLENFLLNNDYSMINHGSWGAVPKEVFDYKMKLLRDHEALPEYFFRKTLYEEQERNSEAIAKFVGTEPNSVALTDNTTFGVNSSIMSAPLSEGDSILVQSFTYKATACVAERIAEQKGFIVRTLDIRLPIKSDDDIVQLYANELEKYPDIRMIILDHISSAVPILWPVEKLMNLFRAYDVIILIDGAHAPGQVSVCLDELQPDYYVASLHKWNFVPRSCGMLYVADGRQESMHNIMTSFKYKARPFQKRFHYIGTRDFSSLFCWTQSRNFVEKCGGLVNI
ncbi:DgyrCDS8390 [Dimorphilus gyrociliatus]|uniref:DgyrCDS8390 n=1 Tax=Dimorphilus gyrociliatus TaxID=2664684 RepID=A0A7I8VW79_9ANNE|nr:DgyrCDS8390 [Dimorphilus gyrociliatus]